MAQYNNASLVFKHGEDLAYVRGLSAEDVEKLTADHTTLTEIETKVDSIFDESGELKKATTTDYGVVKLATADSEDDEVITAEILPDIIDAALPRAVQYGSYGYANALPETGVIDVAKGSVFNYTMAEGGDVTLSVANMAKVGEHDNPSVCFSLIITNGGAGMVTWMSGTKWAGGEVPELVQSGTDVVTFLYDTVNSCWYGTKSCLDAKTA